MYTAVSKEPLQCTTRRSPDLREQVSSEYKVYEVLAQESQTFFPLQFWKSKFTRLPLLSQITRIVLTPPATSVPSERIFSITGWIRETRRSRLIPENTELLVKTGQFIRVQGTPENFLPK